MSSMLIFAIVILGIFAIWDLVVGVSNDAVNFLNSSFGSKVASRKVILTVACSGVLIGVLFSSGMMEVARKGIFHPSLFTMPELMTIFLAVMLTDIMLLDLFNTYGLPTSTTVSIVFELFGAAVAVALLKVFADNLSATHIGKYINTAKALAIISGIFLSVIISFTVGAIVQFFSRLIFTFNYDTRIRKYGAIWGGAALSFIIFFILVKGAKGTAFLSEYQVKWIISHTPQILSVTFVCSAIFLQVLLILKFNILKLIVLIGTFALALAFAANDLVNFIGVPLAGWNAYSEAIITDNPYTVLMTALSSKSSSNLFFLFIAGAVMVLSLWFSKKSRTVAETEISLSRQNEGNERFESSIFGRFIARFLWGIIYGLHRFLPKKFMLWIDNRFEMVKVEQARSLDQPSFDLIRASVNLMVASILISYATSFKLPLSTTYVTFMVAMGSSFADRAWGRDSAVYRITGVLTVIGGWIMTAVLAFSIAGITAYILGQSIYFLFLILFIVFVVIRANHITHKKNEKNKDSLSVYDLKGVDDVNVAMSISRQQMGLLLKEVDKNILAVIDNLFNEEFFELRLKRKRDIRNIQKSANVIIANMFKALRLRAQSTSEKDQNFHMAIGLTQDVIESLRDLIIRSYKHISNAHTPLLKNQETEIKEIRDLASQFIEDAVSQIEDKNRLELKSLSDRLDFLIERANFLEKNQLSRIIDSSSKTRLSILYYALNQNFIKICRNIYRIIELFENSMNKL